jgi:hypothetical protein
MTGVQATEGQRALRRVTKVRRVAKLGSVRSVQCCVRDGKKTRACESVAGEFTGGYAGEVERTGVGSGNGS